MTTPRLSSPGLLRPHAPIPSMAACRCSAARHGLHVMIRVRARRDRERFHGQNGRDSSAAGEAGQGQDRDGDGDGRQQSVTHHHPQEHKAIRPAGTIRSRRRSDDTCMLMLPLASFCWSDATSRSIDDDSSDRPLSQYTAQTVHVPPAPSSWSSSCMDDVYVRRWIESGYSMTETCAWHGHGHGRART